MDTETFDMLPLELDPQTKAISTKMQSPQLSRELAELNSLHRNIIGLETPGQTPPPPMPINPKRSAQITKLRESGNAAYKKSQYGDAIRLYTLAADMALQRPPWEPTALVGEELSTLYSNRSQAYMAQQAWAEAAIDAETSVALKRPQNAKAWWRRGRCLVEMGRLKEAQEWVKQALEIDANEQELLGLSKEIDALLEKRKGSA
ncbi:tetratricopeptide [Saccharata proteae CBS 121410]|uniref:Tetratricopeptide n=1 Tax=Saccharata proteae CBS 121410 TaxID=1314787 RepID=A0A9P4LWA2_9PEZI|nr:tetratricopeptide [Saccharata proteae CBS 121410]